MTSEPRAHDDDEPVLAPNVSTGRHEVGRGTPEAGPVETENFYGTGPDDLRAGTGKIEEPPGDPLPATDHPRGPVTGPRDTQGGQLGSDGIPLTDSRADSPTPD